MASSLNASNTFSSTNKIASNEGRFRDHAPHLPAAGKILSSPGDTAAACMKLFEHRAETPPHVRPFRKSFNHEPGRAARHPGKAHDGPPPDIRYGCRSDHSVSASSLVHPHQETAWTERQREAKEGIYHSNRKEPIGTSKSHGTVMPAECHESGFRFGSRSNASESAKAVIYPIDQERAEIEALARTAERQQTSAKAASVRRTDAGEQKDRSYNWGAHQVDPSSFRFGHIERTGNEGGVAAALRPDDDEKTMVVKKVVEDFKDRRTDELGKPKKMWGITAHLPPDHVFGKTNKLKEDWGARECVRGGTDAPTKEEQTLGRSVRRVPDAEVDTSRVFGVPTIRTDLPKPARKRVTEYQNYGDEADAGGLLYPSRFADADVHEEDFLAAVDKQTMQKLSERAGFALSETDFESVWNLSASYTQDGSVSVETFRRALDELGL